MLSVKICELCLIVLTERQYLNYFITMIYSQRLIRGLLLILIMCCSGILLSQKTMFKYLTRIDTPHLQVRTNLDSLMKKRDDYLDATLRFVNVEGELETWDIRVKTRGRFRRRICDIPPLQIDFSKKDLRKADFEEFDKIKLVSPCFDSGEGRQNLYEEFLVYELYRALTDESFEVKPVRITLKDNFDPAKEISFKAFILEPNNELAERVGGIDVDRYSLPPDSLVAGNYLRVAMFQFMVGNFDWDLQVQRNIRIIFLEEKGKYIIVPYDFDFSAFVAAKYVLAPEGLGIDSRKDRVYLGSYFSEIIDETIAFFLQKQDDLKQVVQSAGYLSKEQKKAFEDYLTSFFKFIRKKGDELEYGIVLDYK